MSNVKRTPVGNPVVARIEEVLSRQKRTKRELLQYLDLSDSVFTRWKYDNGQSYVKHLDKISEYLGVSKTYLLFGSMDEDENIALTEEELSLIKMLRVFSEHDKSLILEMATTIRNYM